MQDVGSKSSRQLDFGIQPFGGFGGLRGGSSSATPSYQSSISKETPIKSSNLAPKPPTAVAHTASSDFKASEAADLAVGQRVEHQKFGFGSISKLDLAGNERKATVVFEKNGEKTLLLSFAKLRIVE